VPVTLHIFIDADKETIIHAFHGEDKEAKRFWSHPDPEHTLTYVRVENGKVHAGERPK
jgi:hypothetical protein